MTEYPSPIRAVKENPHAINLWCGVKYLTWHLIYAVGALVMLLGAAIFRVSGAVPASVGSALSGGWSERIVPPLIRVFVYGWVLVGLVGVAFVAISNPVALLLGGVAGIVGLVLLFAVGMVLAEVGARLYSRAGGGSTKPVVRRIYGRCPVSMGQPPRWFEALRRRVW